MVKKFTKVSAPQRSPRSHDFSPGVSQVPMNRNQEKVETSYPPHDPNYTHQTDQFSSSNAESMPRGVSDEQLFRMMNKIKGWTREQFDNYMNENNEKLAKCASIVSTTPDFINGYIARSIERLDPIPMDLFSISTKVASTDNTSYFDLLLAADELIKKSKELRDYLKLDSLDTNILKKMLDKCNQPYQVLNDVHDSYESLKKQIADLITYEDILKAKEDLTEDYIQKQDLDEHHLKILHQIMQSKKPSKELISLLLTDPEDKWRALVKTNKQSSIIDEMMEKIKGTETIQQVLKDRDPEDEVDIEIKELGNGALAETLPNGKILINDDIDEVDDFAASRLVHELSHYIDYQDENYLDRPEERKAFENQVQFLLEKGYTKMDIEEMLLPIFEDYKDKPEAELYLKKLIENGFKNLKATLKIAKTSRISLTFTAEEKAILDKLEAAGEKLGIKIFLAGGLIRDRLSGVENSDLDFVTNKGSEQLAAYLVKTYGLGEAIKMDRSGASMIYMDGRHIDLIDAEKVFSPVKAGTESLEQGQEAELSIFMDDAYRRDLTINSLMYGLQTGKLYDPTGKGLADVNNKIIRTIIDPNLKYRVHAPDMLRAIRFYATKPGYQFAPGMLEAMRENAHRLKSREVGGDISARRIERELRKAELPEDWAKMKAAFAEVGLTDYIGEQIKSVDEDKKGGIEYNFDKQASVKKLLKATKNKEDWASKREEHMEKEAQVKEVSIVAISPTNEEKLLMGIRNDSSRWTLPGGHLEPDESPEQAAIRELKEETDITASEEDLQSLGSKEVIQTGTKDTKLMVHSFTLTTDQLETDASKDPDKECEQWEWIEVQNGLPEEIRANLHNVDDITLTSMGLLEPSAREAEFQKRELGKQAKQNTSLEDKESSIKSFTKQSSDFAGRSLPNDSALPQEQTFTYPYPEGKREDKNYNAGNVLREKARQRLEKMKKLLERSKK